MAFLSKYGVARHIYWEITKRAVTDLAVGADWTPAAGDVKISKDGGAAANVTNLPTAIAMGNTATWDYSLTSTEMQAAQVKITVADAATKAVEDTSFTIETYGNASAQHPFDLATATQSVTVTTNNDKTGYTVSTVSDKTGYALTSGERTSIADALLDRDMSTGTDSGSPSVRTVRQALRFLRNLWQIVGGTLTVMKEDDTTASWTGTVTTTAGDPVSKVDPA